MPASSLPMEVKKMLSSRQMREHHSLWHLARRWNTLNSSQRNFLTSKGYSQPPRLENEPGAGLDFLGMHRKMIEEVNLLLASINDPSYSKITGWRQIPFDHNDADYPMPPIWEGAEPSYSRNKSQIETDRWRQEVSNTYENNTWLTSITLDGLGSNIEHGIHNWLHLHWSSEPWFKSLPEQDRDDMRNDFLGSTYSSHVNDVFWKLHGWIDDRIGQWEAATGQLPNFAGVWLGPAHQHHASVVGSKTKDYIETPKDIHELLDKFFL
jgi:hypothetical protein